jgi:hypothetical protein
LAIWAAASDITSRTFFIDGGTLARLDQAGRDFIARSAFWSSYRGHGMARQRMTSERMHQKIRIIASLAFLAASPSEARSAPANTLPDLWRELSACVKASPGDSAGSELTIIFALKRDGSLLGKPRITHSHLLGDADAQNAFVAGAIGALAKCLPISITDDLGGAIAGRPLSIRVGRVPKQTDT